VEAGDSAFVTGGSGFIGGRLIGRLTREGIRVRALARSDGSAAKVESLGAEPVRGDLDDEDAMRAGAAGCKYAFHAAAKVEDWGDPADFERLNVEGTNKALRAAKAAGVERFVHVGTEAALLNGNALVNADESAPLRPDSKSLYPATKAKAERAVRGASRDGFTATVVRPRFVWGPDDTSVLPAIVDLVESGRFRFIGGGEHRTSTTHVDNCVEGLILAADKGQAGAAYFVTDGEPIVFKEWIKKLLATRGVEVPDKSIPLPVASAVAAAGETVWKLLRRTGSPPPVTRFSVWVAGLECTLDDSLARRELGYLPVITREQGLADLAEQ
jgi:nucleoside-diphosphate-sugar epimerase